MKFKDWKKQVQNVEFDIPDIYNKIKPFVEERNILPTRKQDSTFSRFAVKRLNYSLMPIFTLVFFILLVLGSIGLNSISNSKNGGPNLEGFETSDQISEILLANREAATAYSKEFTTSPIISLFKSGLFGLTSDDSIDLGVEKSKANAYIANSDPKIQTGDIIQTEDNLVYYLTSDTLSVIKVEESNLVLQNAISYRGLDSANRPQGNHKLYLTDDYLVVIYDQLNGVSKEVVLKVYDKRNLTDTFTYRVKGSYLNSYLIDDNLYLLNNYNISNFLNKETKEVPLPYIEKNDKEQNINYQNIKYSEDFIGEAYTIISKIELGITSIKSSETIILSYSEWNLIYPTSDSIYLVNTQQNSNPNLEYGTYTSFMKFDTRRLEYKGSFKFKGSVVENSFNRYDGYLRIATTIKDYDVTKNPLMPSVKHSNTTNRILVFQEEWRGFELVSNFVVGSEDLNETISSVRFDGLQVYVYPFPEKSLYYDIDFSKNHRNMDVIKVSSSFNLANLNPFGKKSGITLEESNKSNEQYRLGFYDTSIREIVSWNEGIISIVTSDYNYFPIIEAISNPNAMFTKQIYGKYYFGFLVRNPSKTNGKFHIYVVDELNNKIMSDTKTSDSKPYNRLAHFKLTNNDYFVFVGDDRIELVNSDFEGITKLDIK